MPMARAISVPMGKMVATTKSAMAMAISTMALRITPMTPSTLNAPSAICINMLKRVLNMLMMRPRNCKLPLNEASSPVAALSTSLTTCTP